MPSDHDADPAGLGPPDVEDLLDLWAWVHAYRSAVRERASSFAHLTRTTIEDDDLAQHIDALVAIAAQDARQLDEALEAYLGRSVPPWAIWERAFGWRPGRRQIQLFLGQARAHDVDIFPIGDHAGRARHVLGVAVEHTYRYLADGQGWDRVVEWTFHAALLHQAGVVPRWEAREDTDRELVESASKRSTPLDRTTWPERVKRILDYKEVQDCLRATGGDAARRRGPQLAARKAVALLAGPSWRTCEEAHKTARAEIERLLHKVHKEAGR